MGIGAELVLNSFSKSERNSFTVAPSESFLPSHQYGTITSVIPYKFYPSSQQTSTCIDALEFFI